MKNGLIGLFATVMVENEENSWCDIYEIVDKIAEDLYLINHLSVDPSYMTVIPLSQLVREKWCLYASESAAMEDHRDNKNWVRLARKEAMLKQTPTPQ